MTTPFPPPHPRYAMVRWEGKTVRCRVLAYHRAGYFFFLAPDDSRLYRHRDAVTFVP